ncbi:SRPBCC family protein [Lentzea alba]|uniref:SRPBCC family protein n=1 Tax=Lentzea alba TaxID=2714351 RepID=UPI0039BF228B
MASIYQEIVIEAGAQEVWAVIGEFATGPSRMAPGFVEDTRLDGECRVVTFADGVKVRERPVTVDHDARRLVYSVISGSVTPEHDNAVMQVFEEGERSRLVWTRDVLPDALAEPMADAMEHGLKVIKQTLDAL